MPRFALPLALLLPTLALASTLQGHAVVKVGGMTCGGCEEAVRAGLEGVEGVTSVGPVVHDRTCVDLDAPVEEDVLRDAVTRRGFEVLAVAQVSACPTGEPEARTRTALWSDPGELDAQVVSYGETFHMDEALVPGKTTIIHFGADWCGPCRVAEGVLKAELPGREDVAVRAVVLEGRTPRQSFAHPVVEQYGIAGVPMILVVDDRGGPLYVGPDARAALAAL